MVIDDAAQPAGGNIAHPLQLRAAAQKNHFATGKSIIPRVGHIAQQGIAGRVNVIGNRIFGDGDVFGAAGGAAGFGKINGAPFPQHVVATLFYLLNVRFEGFIISDGNGLSKLLQVANRLNMMVFTKFCIA